MKARDQKHSKKTMIFALTLAWFAIAMSNSEAPAQEPEDAPQAARQRPAQPAHPGAQRTLPIPFRLEQPHRVEISGIQLPADARVTSVLAGQVDVSAAGSPSENRVELVPGLVTYKKLKLSGSLPVIGDHVQWFQNMRQGNVDRRAGSLIIMGRDRQEIQRFNFFEAMPVGFEIDIPHSQWHLIIAFEWFEPA